MSPCAYTQSGHLDIAKYRDTHKICEITIDIEEYTLAVAIFTERLIHVSTCPLIGGLMRLISICEH